MIVELIDGNELAENWQKSHYKLQRKIHAFARMPNKSNAISLISFMEAMVNFDLLDGKVMTFWVNNLDLLRRVRMFEYQPCSDKPHVIMNWVHISFKPNGEEENEISVPVET